MLTRMIVAVAVIGTVAGCGRDPKPPANQPGDPLLSGLEPPPLNTPLHEPPGERQQVSAPQLPPGPASVLLVTRGGRPFIGVANLTGRLTVAANRIRIEPAQDSALEILYRLPAGLSLRTGTTNGSIAVTERSGPGGADQLVVVRSESRLALAEIWQRSLKPLSVDLGSSLRLQQRLARAVAAGYAEAPLDVLDNGRVLSRAPIGRLTRIEASAGRYVVLAEVSHLFTPATSDAEQFGAGYILRAWVVPVR